MAWDDWTRNGMVTSARQIAELSEKEEREKLVKKQAKEMEQIIEDFKYEQNRLLKIKELEQKAKLEAEKSKFEKEKLEFEKIKEKMPGKDPL